MTSGSTRTWIRQLPADLGQRHVLYYYPHIARARDAGHALASENVGQVGRNWNIRSGVIELFMHPALIDAATLWIESPGLEGVPFWKFMDQMFRRSKCETK